MSTSASKTTKSPPLKMTSSSSRIQKPVSEADTLIKSRERVRDLAEVYTAEREVNAMLDLVKDEASRVDSRFLEPACGNGNFLAAILKRKLVRIARRKLSQQEFEFNTVVAVSSIYGIDICPENVEESQQRMLVIVREHYYGAKRNTWKAPDNYFQIIEHLLEKNIVVGDSINGPQHILFSEWSFPAAGKVKERVFRLSEMTQERPAPIQEFPLRKWTEILNE